MKSYISIDNEANQISINLKFFNRIFIEKPPKDDKLTALSLRVVALLLQSMSDVFPRKLPSRTKMAKKLGVSPVAVNNALLQLDINGLIIRAPEGMDGFVSIDDETTKMYQQRTAERISNDREQKRFSGKFTINPNYNITHKDYLKESVEAAVEHFILSHPEINIDEAFCSLLAEDFKQQIQTILEKELGSEQLGREENHD